MEIITLESLKNDPRGGRLNLKTISSPVDSNDIEKGDIHHAITYGNLSSHTVKKKGKEINALIASLKDRTIAQKDSMIELMPEIKKLIGVECDDSYTKDGVKLNRYSWSLIDSMYPVDGMGARIYTEEARDENAKHNLCEKYNSMGYRIRDLNEDLVAIAVLESAFDDNTTYDIPLKTLFEIMKKDQE